MTPRQRLEHIVCANWPRVYGGMRGSFELLAAQGTSAYWRRKAAEGLICVRENRSALQAMGIEHRPVAARKLFAVRCFRLKAAAIGLAEHSQTATSQWRRDREMERRHRDQERAGLYRHLAAE